MSITEVIAPPACLYSQERDLAADVAATLGRMAASVPEESKLRRHIERQARHYETVARGRGAYDRVRTA